VSSSRGSLAPSPGQDGPSGTENGSATAQTKSPADHGTVQTGPAPTGGAEASLVVVANRLPFDLQRNPDGSTTARQAPGGLVTALAPLLARQHGAWIGWPGSADLNLEPTTADNVVLYPVKLTGGEVAGYYEGFSNATLWPLYHDAVADPEFHRQWWEVYERVNQRFAAAAAEVAGPDAIVWVHDYQLQLVPAMLRRLRPDVRIGFFLHIPFPPSELFMRLPWRAEIINGLLGADVVGFQLPGGARNFVRLARTLTGAAVSGSLIEHDGRTVRAAAFPISIDSTGQAKLAASSQVQEEAAKLREELGNPRRLILGIDRLDYTKGINVRLRAFGELLAERDPSAQDTVMVQIATPSRERLHSYARMREEIERQVGALNGEHGRIGRPAVHYLHHSLPREELAAFYVAADVMTVTPLRDGMNLVAKEYVACRVDGGGVLLLSEFTGAARELRSAVLVNPYDTDGVKEGLRQALNMPEQEARQRMRALRRQVLTHDVDRWASSFLGTVREHRDRIATAAGRLPAGVVRAARRVSTTERLLIATDFDGTLAPIVDDPDDARPVGEALESLHAIAALPDTVVAVISGRSLADLQALVGDPGRIHLIGSHGAERRQPTETAAGFAAGPRTLTPAETSTLDALRTSLDGIAARHPGVRLEHKPVGVAVHLRQASDHDADAVQHEIASEISSDPAIRTMHGKKVVELSVVAVDKGSALETLRAQTASTATVFIGDDVTDEHAFTALGPHDLGVKVGPGDSAARLRVDSPTAVADLLGVLLSARGGWAVRREERASRSGRRSHG
jgi:trehalose 6-phosphate synthase/phosphatase